MKHSFEKFCKDYENIENYEKAKADNFKGWCCHHRKGEFTPTEELKALDMYYNRPAEELIFIKESEHKSLHKPSEEARNKMREAKKGEKNPNYGKHFSEEHKKKIGEAMKGARWFNNGKINIRAKECPDGFIPGMLRK